MSIDRDKILQTAQKHVERKRFDKAIVEYQKLVQHDDNDARTLLKIGDLQTRIEDFEQAIVTYEKAARFYSTQRMSLKAIAVYKQIRELIRKHCPDLANRYSYILPNLAGLYLDLGLSGDAIATYDEYAARLHATGRDGEALEVFQKIVDINGNNPLTRLRFGEALIRQSQVEQAFQLFSVAAFLLLDFGRSNDALKVLERMLFQKSDPNFARRAAEIYLQRGSREDGMLALANLQICFQADNRDLRTLSLLASAFEKLEQTSKAIEVQKEIGRIARDKGEFALARKTVEMLLREAPEDEGVKSLAKSILAADKASVVPALPKIVEPPIARSQSLSGQSAPPSDDVVVEVSEQVDRGVLAELFDSEVSPQQPAVTKPSESQPYDVERQPKQLAYPDADSAEPVSKLLEPLSSSHVESEHLLSSHSVEQVEPYETVLAQAGAYRDQRDYASAVQTLQTYLQTDPNNIHAIDMLKEICVATRDYPGACNLLMQMASLYLNALDTDTTVHLLTQVLALDPEHAEARTMLRELGFAVPAAVPVLQQAQPRFEPLSESVIPPSLFPTNSGSFDSSQPLPSYDLEEIHPELAMSQVSVSRSQNYVNLLRSDNSFAPAGSPASRHEAGQYSSSDAMPLPSFPLLENPAAVMAQSAQPAVEAKLDRSGPLPSYHSDHSINSVEQSVLVPLAGTQAFCGGDSLEIALEEAVFFASRSLFEDALAILHEQVQRHPDNPLLLERIAEVTEAQARANAPHNAPLASLETTESDPVYNLAASMGNFGVNALDAFVSEGYHHSGNVDVEDVFAQFKQGVREQISEADSQTHYDLGVAYKEMGLWKDAIAEFEVASKDPRRECVCWSMIGLVRVQLGDLDGAIEAFIRGLHATTKTDEQELALYYELGGVYEQRSNTAEALYYFETVLERDPSFRDIEERIQILRAGNTMSEHL